MQRRVRRRVPILTKVDLIEWQTLGPEAGSLKGIVPIFDRTAERTVGELQSTGKLAILQLRTGIKNPSELMGRPRHSWQSNYYGASQDRGCPIAEFFAV